MMPPTIANLRFVAACDDAEAALAVADAVGDIPMIMPKLRRTTDGSRQVSLPGDPDYDDL